MSWGREGSWTCARTEILVGERGIVYGARMGSILGRECPRRGALGLRRQSMGHGLGRCSRGMELAASGVEKWSLWPISSPRCLGVGCRCPSCCSATIWVPCGVVLCLWLNWGLDCGGSALECPGCTLQLPGHCRHRSVRGVGLLRTRRGLVADA